MLALSHRHWWHAELSLVSGRLHDECATSSSLSPSSSLCALDVLPELVAAFDALLPTHGLASGLAVLPLCSAGEEWTANPRTDCGSQVLRCRTLKTVLEQTIRTCQCKRYIAPEALLWHSVCPWLCTHQGRSLGKQLGACSQFLCSNSSKRTSHSCTDPYHCNHLGNEAGRTLALSSCLRR